MTFEQAKQSITDILKRLKTKQIDRNKAHALIMNILTQVKREHGPQVANSLIILHRLDMSTRGHVKQYFDEPSINLDDYM